MTESVESDINTLAEGRPQGAVLAGMMLKEAREKSGLHIAALAVGLKVPVSKLEALEAGRLEALSGPVFVRALAASVCRALKVDPTDIVVHLPMAPAVRLPQNGHLNEPFRGADRTLSIPLSERLLRPSGLAVMGLVLGAVLLLAWPHVGVMDVVAEASPSPSLFPTPSAENRPGTVPPPDADLPKVVQQHEPEVAVTQGPSQGTSAPVSKPASAASLPNGGMTGSASGPSASVAVQVPSGVVFKASAASWIEVTDGAGTVVLRKTLAPGESEPVNGTLPFKIVVGRADVTDVFIRGLRFDLQPWTKENVARFEVK